MGLLRSPHQLLLVAAILVSAAGAAAAAAVYPPCAYCRPGRLQSPLGWAPRRDVLEPLLGFVAPAVAAARPNLCLQQQLGQKRQQDRQHQQRHQHQQRPQQVQLLVPADALGSLRSADA